MKTLLLSLVLLLSFTSLAQPPAYVPTDSLVGWWPFNANANDESGSGNDGTVNGATLTTDRFGTANAAYDFDGVDDIIEIGTIGNSSFENDFTISLWSSFSNFDNNYSHLIYGENSYIVLNGNGPAYTSDTSKVSGYQGPLTPVSSRRIPYSSSITKLDENTYYHIVYLKRGALAYIYINGIIEATVATNNSLAIPSGNFLQIGSGYLNTSDYCMNGSIDDIGIWNRALTQCEVSGLYESQLPSCATSCLVAQYDFNGNADDLSGWGNHGTVNGATLTTDRFGNANSAYSFDGVDDYIEVMHSSNLNTLPLTINIWVKTQAIMTGQNGSIISKYSCQMNNGYSLFAYGGNIATWYFGDNGSVINPSYTNYPFISDDSWHMLSVVYDSTELTAYLDNNFILTEPWSGAPTANSDFYNLYFGYYLQGSCVSDGYFEGSIDDASLYSCALTQCEISALYHAQTLTPPLVDLGTDTLSTCGATTTLDAGTDPSWASYLWNTTETTQSISISDPGLYLVEVTDTNGCIGYDTTLVTIINPTITPSDTIICLGDSVTLAIDTISGNSCIGLPVNLQNGLVAHYPFCGNANDESGNGNDGVVNGASLTADRFGNANSAYSFDGVDDYIEVVTLSLNNVTEYSYSVWVKKNSSSSVETTIICQDNPTCGCGPGGLRCSVNGAGQLYFLTEDAGPSNVAIISDTTGLNDDKWHYFTLVFSSVPGVITASNFTMYLDGIYLSSYAIFGTGIINSPIDNGSLPTVIGNTTTPYSNPFDGYIDDIAIYNRALTSTEIQQLYTESQYDITWSTGDTTSSITVQPTTTTTYSVTIDDGIGSCTDNATVTVSVPPVDAGTAVAICDGDNITLSGSGADTYAWSGGVSDGVAFTPTASEYYYVTGTDSIGCQNNDSVFVSVLQHTSSSITQTRCDAFTAPNGVTYTMSGIYTAIIPNASNCDSTITIDLTILNSTTNTLNLTKCNTYTAPDGAVYVSSGIYAATIGNVAGCDSIITINLTINYGSSSSVAPASCGSYMAPDGAVYTSTGIYTAIIPNAANCDSTITINLTVNNPTLGSITEIACDAYTAPDASVYTTTGIYTAVISNAANCDSTITIDLTVNNSSTGTVTQTVCDTYTAPDGMIYTSTGMYTAVISNAANCDSTITIDLTVNNATTSSISETALDSYTAPSGAVYTTSGVFNDTIANAAGCDSVITITLTMSHTGIEELKHQPIFLTPNPTSDFITIVGIENVTEIKSMELVSSAGRVVAVLKVGTLKIDVSMLSSGTYFLSITHANGTERIRFVKE